MAKETTKKETANNDCFLIMPISDQNGYEPGHFSRVFEDLFKPACEQAAFAPYRADDAKGTGLIQLEILNKLIECPMAICDLSSRNPNVLFELGLRQAFDKPTLLVKDEDTPAIFDIIGLRYITYRKNLKYREVLHDQAEIAKALIATKEATDKNEVNSLIRLLALNTPAALKEVSDDPISQMLQVIMNQVEDMRAEMRNSPIKNNSIRSLRPSQTGNLYSDFDIVYLDSEFQECVDALKTDPSSKASKAIVVRFLNLCNELYSSLNASAAVRNKASEYREILITNFSTILNAKSEK